MVVKFVWLPTPRIVFEADAGAQELAIHPNPGQAVLLKFDDVPGTLTGMVVGTRFPPFSISGIVDNAVVGASAAAVDSVRFLLPNTPQMFGEWIRESGNSGWVGRVTLADGEWRIRLEARRSVRETAPILRASGGYAFTHTGLLSRSDKRVFRTRRRRRSLSRLQPSCPSPGATGRPRCSGLECVAPNVSGASGLLATRIRGGEMGLGSRLITRTSWWQLSRDS
jgi:hypothetical protein